jgi:hypothetical protein
MQILIKDELAFPDASFLSQPFNTLELFHNGFMFPTFHIARLSIENKTVGISVEPKARLQPSKQKITPMEFQLTRKTIEQ